MNVRIVWHLAALVFPVLIGQAIGIVDYNTGASIQLTTPVNDSVRVDWNKPGVHTTLTLLAGGAVGGSVGVYHDGQVNLAGGSVGTYLEASGNSRITITGGTVGWEVVGYNNSHITLLGGRVSNELIGCNDTRIDWSGGIVNGSVILNGEATMVLAASHVKIDGTPVSGDITSLLGGSVWNEPYRRLTGTLANGDPINTLFQIGDTARIYLFPEPSTAALLGLGICVLRRLLRP